jgi:hypothetical protein
MTGQPSRDGPRRALNDASGGDWKQDQAMRAGPAGAPEFGQSASMRKNGAHGEVALPGKYQRFMERPLFLSEPLTGHEPGRVG